jgi:prepilin-type N-terminal cleavage/methylation domain-containing protein
MINRQRLSQPPQGFTLIEALVAAALLGLGMMGAISLAMHSLQAAGSSRQQSTALTLAQNTIDCLRSGPALCPGSVALASSGQAQENQTLSGTTYQINGELSSTSMANLQSLLVTVKWQPTGSSATYNPMSPGSGQVTLRTRLSSVPVFVQAAMP